MSTRSRKLTLAEVRAAFADSGIGPILSPVQLATVLGLSSKTVYEWIAKGRLDGAFRKRGKHNLLWRDRAIEIVFNGPEWT
jgi:excisionase family DNA binding protein